jgi:hypothetical protein
MTFIASGPATCGTGGSVGFITGTGAGTTGAVGGAGSTVPGSGTGAVVAGGVAHAPITSENPARMWTMVLVVFMDAWSSFSRSLIAWSIPDMKDAFADFEANIPGPTYIPAMLWHHVLILNSFSRARNRGALITL